MGYEVLIKLMKDVAMFFLLALASGISWAAEPNCYDHAGGPYCSYTGSVQRLYLNDTGRILVYFDTQLDVAKAQSVGINVSQSKAATYVVSDNPDYAKMLYSTLLAAQSSGRDVEIHMRGVGAGYLVVDRVWLSK